MSDKKQNISCAQRRALPENLQSMVLELVLIVSGGFHAVCRVACSRSSCSVRNFGFCGDGARARSVFEDIYRERKGNSNAQDGKEIVEEHKPLSPPYTILCLPRVSLHLFIMRLCA